MKISDFLGNEWDIDCMGCAVADGSMQVPGGFIQKTEYFYVHQDPLTPIPGFIVIASKRHIHSIADMQDLEFEEFAALVRTVHHGIKAVTQVEHLTIVQEERSQHFHLWFFPWTQSIVEQYGGPALTKIRQIMSAISKQPIDKSTWEVLKQSIEKIKAYLT